MAQNYGYNDEPIDDFHFDSHERNDRLISGPSNDLDHTFEHMQSEDSCNSMAKVNESNPLTIQLVIEFTCQAPDELIATFHHQLLINHFEVIKCDRQLLIRLRSSRLLIEAALMQNSVWSSSRMQRTELQANDRLLCRLSYLRKSLSRLEQARLCQRVIRRTIRSSDISSPSRSMAKAQSIRFTRPMLDVCLDADLCRAPYCPSSQRTLQSLRFRLLCWAVTFGYCTLPTEQVRQFFGASIALQFGHLELLIYWLLWLGLVGQLFQLFEWPHELFALVSSVFTFLLAHLCLRTHCDKRCAGAEPNCRFADTVIASASDAIEQRCLSNADLSMIPDADRIKDQALREILNQSRHLALRLGHANRITNLWLLFGLTVHLLGSVAFVRSLVNCRPSTNQTQPVDYEEECDSSIVSYRTMIHLYFVYTGFMVALGERLVRLRARSLSQMLQLIECDSFMQPQIMMLHIVSSVFVPLYSQLALTDWYTIRALVGSSIAFESLFCFFCEILLPFVTFCTNNWRNKHDRSNHFELSWIRVESNKLSCPGLTSNGIRCMKLFALVVLCSSVRTSIPLAALAVVWLQTIALVWQLGWWYQRPIAESSAHVVLPETRNNWTATIVCFGFLVDIGLIDTYSYVHSSGWATIDEQQWTFVQLCVAVLATLSLVKRLQRKCSDCELERSLCSTLFQFNQQTNQLKTQNLQLQKSN
jgi:hypothetical protein